MKRLLLIIVILLVALPVSAQKRGIKAAGVCRGNETPLIIYPDSEGIFWGIPLPVPGIRRDVFGWYPSDFSELNVTAVSMDATIDDGYVRVLLHHWETLEWWGTDEVGELTLPTRFKKPITINELIFMRVPSDLVTYEYHDWTFHSFTLCLSNWR